MKLYSFIETPTFTKRVLKIYSDDEYARLQWYLIHNTDIGDLIVGGGGIRKMRWTAKGKGKRGGARVIYYLAGSRGEIFMLDIYTKNEKSDLTPDELKKLRQIVEVWLQ
jgi:hypothetical protein